MHVIQGSKEKITKLTPLSENGVKYRGVSIHIVNTNEVGSTLTSGTCARITMIDQIDPSGLLVNNDSLFFQLFILWPTRQYLWHRTIYCRWCFLTLKVPNKKLQQTTYYFFTFIFRRKLSLIFHVNHLSSGGCT